MGWGPIGAVVARAKDVAGGVAGAVGDAVSSATDAVGGFVRDHWKTIATIGVGVVVFVGTAALVCALPVGIGLYATYFIAGAASGVASQAVRDLLNGRRPGWDLVTSGLASGIFSVATAGAINFAAPLLSRAAAASSRVPNAAARVIARAADGGARGGAASVEAPAAVAARGAAVETGAAAPSAGNSTVVVPARQALRRSPKAHGFVGILTGEDGSDPGERAAPAASPARSPAPVVAPAPRRPSAMDGPLGS